MNNNKIKLYVIVDFDALGNFYSNARPQDQYDANGFVDFLANKAVFSGSANKGILLSNDTEFNWTLCNLQTIDQPMHLEYGKSNGDTMNYIEFSTLDDVGDPQDFWFSIFVKREGMTINEDGNLIVRSINSSPATSIKLDTVAEYPANLVFNISYTINFNFDSSKIGTIDPIITNRGDDT